VSEAEEFIDCRIMACYATNQQLSNFVVIPALILLLVCNLGCQTFSGNQRGQTELKTVEQIAQESISAVESRLDQFETINSPKAPARPAPKRIQTSSPTRQYQTRNPSPNANALIDEIFDQTDIRDALQAISTQANVSIIVDDQVAGSVTTLIQNEPLELALQKVLLPLGLHYRVVNNQYLVCSSDPSSPMFSMISDRRDYSPAFTPPQELIELLSEKNRYFVRIAAKRNMVIVEAPSEIANQIVHELQLFDRPVPQVVLEAMVIVVSPDSGFKFGVNLKHLYAENDQAISVALQGLELAGNFTGALADDLFSKFSTTSFFIRALEQEGYLSIRATPHVMAKNGEKAEISISRETFFSTQPFFDTNVFVRQEIQKVEAGISLIITPTIRGGNVDMVIEKAEVSEDIRATIDDPAIDNPYPLINRRQVSTTVNVRDGETVVIGGLMQNQMVDRVSRVPFFSNIPLIGPLFNKTVKEEQAAEVVVLISPKIVYQNDDHPMAGSVSVAQNCNEYCFQRRFPRDNGLEIGDHRSRGGYQEATQYDSNYGSAQPQANPVYQAPHYQNYNRGSQAVPIQTAPQKPVPITQQIPAQPQANPVYQAPHFQNYNRAPQTVPIQMAPQQYVPITLQIPGQQIQVQQQAGPKYQPPRYQGATHATRSVPMQTAPVAPQQQLPRTQQAPVQSYPPRYFPSQSGGQSAGQSARRSPTPNRGHRQQTRPQQIAPRVAPDQSRGHLPSPGIVARFSDAAVRPAAYQQPVHQSPDQARR
jgi:type IV pilus assembly protein PilQ